jgi:hypothetical protein
MRMNRVRVLVARMLLVVMIMVGFVVLTGTTAEAQSWRFDRHNRRAHSRVIIYPRVYNQWYWRDATYPYYYDSYYFPSTHVTEDQGYRDGLNDGQDDAEDREEYNPYKHNDYKNAATSGYINGYLRGYAEGYD